MKAGRSRAVNIKGVQDILQRFFMWPMHGMLHGFTIQDVRIKGLSPKP